ncbi:hypothetical protein JP74_22270 [Devosia sp. 17-2-E-8]|nr:hypothetical protein JP74_22270 [Devosia sp. 17-2-E-8]
MADFLRLVTAPVAAFMATKAADGTDLHLTRSGRPERKRRMAKAGDFASRCKAPLGARRKIVGRSDCLSGPAVARSPSQKAVGAAP